MRAVLGLWSYAYAELSVRPSFPRANLSTLEEARESKRVVHVLFPSMHIVKNDMTVNTWPCMYYFRQHKMQDLSSLFGLEIKLTFSIFLNTAPNTLCMFNGVYYITWRPLELLLKNIPAVSPRRQILPCVSSGTIWWNFTLQSHPKTIKHFCFHMIEWWNSAELYSNFSFKSHMIILKCTCHKTIMGMSFLVSFWKCLLLDFVWLRYIQVTDPK